MKAEHAEKIKRKLEKAHIEKQFDQADRHRRAILRKSKAKKWVRAQMASDSKP